MLSVPVVTTNPFNQRRKIGDRIFTTVYIAPPAVSSLEISRQDVVIAVKHAWVVGEQVKCKSERYTWQFRKIPEV